MGCDIVEFGAVKWQGGRIVDELQMLIKPRERMTDFIIGIHGITNEMVAEAPSMAEVLPRILKFFDGAIPVAHHAPFDMGFVAADVGKHKAELPMNPALCTSLLSRQLISGVENHKLQTLVKFLKIDGGAAHRALDDARSCLYVALECFKRLGENAPLAQLYQAQGKKLEWPEYLVYGTKDVTIDAIVAAVSTKSRIQFIYDKGTEPRQAEPMGLVRSPDGDFMQAKCLRDNTAKRFYLAKMKQAAVVPNSATPTQGSLF